MKIRGQLAPFALLGSMATIALPASGPFGCLPPTIDSVVKLNGHLWEKHRIEVPAILFADRLWVRISAQIYNELEDYERLASAVLARRPSRAAR